MEVGPGLGYAPVANDELAALVTYLEMRTRPDAPVPESALALRGLKPVDLDHYRRLYRLVGARWLWFSRLLRDDETLGAIVNDPAVDVFAVVDPAGAEVGFLELDYREPGQCELAFVGLIPEMSGKGHGKWLLAEALRLAWRNGVERVHVHTCTLDHPAALSAYRRAGFVPFKRAIERFADPRLLGHLPRDCAPQVPLLGDPAS